MAFPKMFVSQRVIDELEKAGEINHLSVSSLLLVISHALIKGKLTVYNGEIMTQKTIYHTDKGNIIR